jgi:Holliday junction resolvasome RuvABC endonuclease subunit
VNIVGLDLSLTATGVADTSGTSVLSTKLRGCERLAWLREEIVCLFPPLNDGTQDGLAVMEGYSYASANQAHQAGELGGVIRLALHEGGVPCIVVSPKTLKKYATGHGNAGKEEVLAAAIRRLNYEGHNNNEADALWLRQIGLAKWSGLHVVPESHRVALDAVILPAEIGAP